MASSGESVAWHQRLAAAEGRDADTLYRALADDRRRAVLGVLDGRSLPISMAVLARLVAAREAGTAPAAVSDARRRRVRSSLYHVHLPPLAATGLLAHSDDGSVVPRGHAVWSAPDFRSLLDREEVAAEEASRALDALANGQRRAVLAILHDRRTIALTALADELAGSPVADGGQRPLAAALRHRHVPKLEAAGLVDVDSEGRRLQYVGNQFLEDWWFSTVRRRRRE